MRLEHFLDLVFVFVLNHFDQSILVVFILVLCAVASLLQLLQGDLKFSLRLNQILFVVLFLILQELALALPESLVFVICRLKVRELSLQILHGGLELHDGLCLRVAVVVRLSSARVKILNLSLVVLNLLLVLSLLLPLVLIKPGVILLQQTQLLLKLSVFPVELLLDLLESLALLLKLLLPHIFLTLNSLKIGMILLICI